MKAAHNQKGRWEKEWSMIGATRWTFIQTTSWLDDLVLTERVELPPLLHHTSDRNTALSPTLQVLLVLRYYANGAFQNIMGDMINVHRTTACRAIRRVSLALQSFLRHYIHLPTQEAARTKPDFYLKSRIPGIVGCIDGTHAHSQASSDQAYLYVIWKGSHSSNVQIVCNLDMATVDLVAMKQGASVVFSSEIVDTY